MSAKKTEEKVSEITRLCNTVLKIEVTGSWDFEVSYQGNYGFMNRRGDFYEGIMDATSYSSLIDKIYEDLMKENILWGEKY